MENESIVKTLTDSVVHGEEEALSMDSEIILHLEKEEYLEIKKFLRVAYRLQSGDMFTKGVVVDHAGEDDSKVEKIFKAMAAQLIEEETKSE